MTGQGLVQKLSLNDFLFSENTGVDFIFNLTTP